MFISNNIHYTSFCTADGVSKLLTVLILPHQQSSQFCVKCKHDKGSPSRFLRSSRLEGFQKLPLGWPSYLQSPTRLIHDLPTEASLMQMLPRGPSNCISRSCLPGSQCALTDPAIFCPHSQAICLTILSRVLLKVKSQLVTA